MIFYLNKYKYIYLKMDDWLKDTQDFTEKKDPSGNTIPLTQTKLNKEANKESNIDINDAFDQVANHYVEYKNIQQSNQKPQVNKPQELSLDKNIQKNKKKKKFNQQKIRTSLNDEDDEYFDEYNDEYDDLVDKYK